MTITWSLLGGGTFNQAWLSDDRTLVLKIQRDKTDQTDLPERSVRLWNGINSHLSPQASLYSNEGISGWTCPFIQGRQASDTEMKDALINIFNNTGRIIVDATASNNFITTKDGLVVCVDIGLALQLEMREQELATEELRRKSIVSLDYWNNTSDAYPNFYSSHETEYPETVNIIKSLIFIKNHRPDIFNVDFLRENVELIDKLSAAYDSEEHHFDAIENLDRIVRVQADEKKIPATSELISDSMSDLAKEREISLNNIKESLIKELKRYIDSRTPTTLFSSVTQLFRNRLLTQKKLAQANYLCKIININTYNSLDDLKKFLDTTLKDPSILNGDFAKCIASCKKIITAANQPQSEARLTLGKS